MKKEMRYLVPEDYMADPAVHVFNGRVYIYPSHDWESGIPKALSRAVSAALFPAWR